MRRSLFLVFSFLLISTAVFGQTASTDSQTLQDLLHEVRELRRDLYAAVVTTQRAQIVLYHLQTQQVIVGRMQLRVDDARSRLTEAQANRQNLEAPIKIDEDFQDRTQNVIERKEIEDVLPKPKARFKALGVEEQYAQTREIDAEEQLRAE